jgi:hypothetical protein
MVKKAKTQTRRVNPVAGSLAFAGDGTARRKARARQG